MSKPPRQVVYPEFVLANGFTKKTVSIRALVGVIPLEAMDLIVDPNSLTLGPNPKYPDAPFLRL